MTDATLCMTAGCTRGQRARGHCTKHFEWYRYRIKIGKLDDDQLVADGVILPKVDRQKAPPKKPNKPRYEPTPEEIAAACQTIRADNLARKMKVSNRGHIDRIGEPSGTTVHRLHVPRHGSR